MLTPTSGYPGMTVISPSIMSLANSGIVRIPVTYQTDGLVNQSNYEKAGFQGLGFDPVASVTGSGLDLTSLLTGSTGTLLLIGGAALLAIMFLGSDKRAAKRKDLAQAREKYKEETSKIKSKYGRLGLGL